LAEAEQKNPGKLYVKINSVLQPDILEQIKKVLARYKGEQPVYVVDEGKKAGNNKAQIMVADKNMWVDIKDELIAELAKILGKECVAIKK